jgi:hypothetical protein
MVTGGAIDLDEIALPEILDPRRVEGERSASHHVPVMFLSNRAHVAPSTAKRRAMAGRRSASDHRRQAKNLERITGR